MSADLIVYAIVAAGLVFWLRNVLGTRHGDESQRPNPFVAPEGASAPAKDKAGLPEGMERPITQEERILRLSEDRASKVSVENKTAENALLDISRADRNFNIDQFMDGAQEAFAIIVEAFADGDRETLKDLLNDSVYAAFEGAITAREQRNETQKTQILSIRKAEIIEAKLQGKMAYVTVRFRAEETSVTYDSERNVISGNPDKITDMRDIWTFGRDIKSRDPRWLVYETRGDFDQDNTLIPNA